MTVTTDQSPTPRPDAQGSLSLGRVLRRLPFTFSVLALMLVLGVTTTALWVPLAESGWLERLGYGLPALEAGRWWTPVTGSLLAMTPAQYVPVAGGAALMFGWSEWRLGTRRAATAGVGLQLVGVLGAAALLAVLAPTGWDWAVRTAQVLDAGFSAGALGAVAAASATLTPPWRGRLRLVLTLYVLVAFLYVGLLWDLEHLLAVVAGLALGPVLLGRRPSLRAPRFTRHEWRVVAATTFVVSAAARLVLYFVDSQGPLGATAEDSSATSALVGAGISLVLANGLRKGSRLAWRWAMAGVVLVVGLLLILLVAEISAPDVLAADETTG